MKIWFLIFIFLLTATKIKAQTVNPINFNTAVNAANTGTIAMLANDLNWTASLTNSLGPYVPAVTCPNPGWSNSPNPLANWVTFPHTCSGSPAEHSCLGNINVYYKLSINLPALTCNSIAINTPSAFCLSITFLADNCVSAVYLNGVLNYTTPILTPYGYTGFLLANAVTLNLCSNWQAGNNDLIVLVKSGAPTFPGWEGFLASVNPSLTTNLVNYTNTITYNKQQTNISCFGANNGSATLTPLSGPGSYTYTWLPAGPNFSVNTGLTAGTYSFTISKPNYCPASSTLTITQPLPLTQSISASSFSACTGANISLIATTNGGTGPYSYSWTNGPNSNIYNTTSNASGNYVYTVTVTDSNSCTLQNTISLSFVTTPTITVSSATICSNQSATLNAGGAVTYTWNGFLQGANFVTSPTVTTIYTVTGGNGACVVTKTTAVIVNPNPQTNATSTNITCSGNANGKAQVTASGGTGPYTYAWSTTPAQNGSQAIGLAPGLYSVIVTDANNCSSSQLVIITQPAPILISINSPTVCKNVNTQLISNVSGGTPGYSYTWTPGNANTANLSVTTSVNKVYTLKVKDSQGCVSTATSAVMISPVSAAFSYYLNPCTGQISTNNMSNDAISYAWSFGDNSTSLAASPQHSYSTAGVYTITLVASNSASCTDTAAQTVTVDPKVQSNFNVNLPLCDSTAQLLNTSGGSVLFFWRFGDGTFSQLQQPLSHTYSLSGNYSIWLTSKGANGCVDSVKKDVSVIKYSIAGFYMNRDSCSKKVSFLNTSTLSVFNNWSFGTGDTSMAINPAYIYSLSGNYTVTLITNAGTTCSSNISVPIQIVDPPEAAFTYTVSECNGLVKFSNTSKFPEGSFWRFGDGSNSSEISPTHIYTTSGNYYVQLVVASGRRCSSPVIKNIGITYPKVKANFSYQLNSLSNVVTFTNLSIEAVNYFWDFGDGQTSALAEPKIMFNEFERQLICLIAANSAGCSDTICRLISRGEDWTIYVPNIFTPNDDGLNDIFYAYGSNIRQIKLMVYNRWGAQLFVSQDITHGWNGYYKGKKAPNDIYVWKIDFLDSKNKSHSMTGHVQVMAGFTPEE